MNSSTTRHTSPAASRTGRFVAALPNDPGLDEILADPDLSSTAKALVTVMVRNWAWSKDHCWPCDRTLAAKVGKSVGHVQRCLNELERAGRIRRERTDDVPNGRRLWLLWRCPGGCEGAQREIASARSAPVAPARSKKVVIVNEGKELEIQLSSRPRREAISTSAAIPTTMTCPMAALPEDEPTTPPMPSAGPIAAPMPLPEPQEPYTTPSEEKMGEQTSPALLSHLEVAGERSRDPVPLRAPADPVGPRVALDLGAIGRPAAPLSMPVAAPIPRSGARSRPVTSPSPTADDGSRRKRPGLGLAELIQVAGETADPILAAEVARWTAPPSPPEPPPQALRTHELFEKLPGRHDLIAAATRRLAEEMADFKPASWSFFKGAVEAVATRRVVPEVLLDCRRQATGPKAKNPGSVFVVSWRRETRMSR